ncbi:MAG: epoxyqueuosine reductase [Dethiobacter sp.]|jgi:epoxyqueuosine reductase QueG|nr:epoxyqueuosine reductase [Dethiobacter sp.]
MKEKIRSFVSAMGVDDVGFAAVKDYNSPKSPELESIFPGARSLVVMAFAELDNCESENMQIAFNGRMETMEFMRSCNYKLTRFLNREFKAKAMSVPPSYPLEMSYQTKGSVGDVSLRHAAVAAGLGSFGRHNLVIHPELGSRVLFTAVITDMELSSGNPVEKLCTDCNACIEECPSNALAAEGKTHVGRCLKTSQPYGIGANIEFWTKFADSHPEKQKEMVSDVHFWRLYQAGFVGFQYFCFNCIKTCPIGRE